MNWKKRIHEEAAEIVQQWRDIWREGILWALAELSLSISIAHRRNEARMGRFLERFKPPDPKRFATTPPTGWYGAKPKEVPEHDGLFQIKSGGFAVGFGEKGLIYSHDETVAQQRAAKEAQNDDGTGVVITPEEFGEMVAYKVSKTQTGLHNIALAKLIKPLWLKGQKPAEIAALLSFDRSTVAQYCTCFERAKANNKNGKGNAFEVEVPNF